MPSRSSAADNAAAMDVVPLGIITPKAASQIGCKCLSKAMPHRRGQPLGLFEIDFFEDGRDFLLPFPFCIGRPCGPRRHFCIAHGNAAIYCECFCHKKLLCFWLDRLVKMVVGIKGCFHSEKTYHLTRSRTGLNGMWDMLISRWVIAMPSARHFHILTHHATRCIFNFCIADCQGKI